MEGNDREGEERCHEKMSKKERTRKEKKEGGKIKRGGEAMPVGEGRREGDREGG